MPALPARPRLLVVKLSSLGDIVHALPTVERLHAGTEARIDWVTQPEYVDLLRCCPLVDRVIPFPRRRFWRGLPALRTALRESTYDAVIDLQGLLKSALVGFLSGCPLRLGPSFHREGSRLFYTRIAGPPDRARHRVEQKLDVVAHLGLPIAPVRFPLVFPPAPLDLPRPRLALVPCSRHREKNWPVAHFAEVGRAFVRETGGCCVILGGPGDARTGEALAGAIGPGAVNRAGATSIVELGSLLGEMDVLLGNDSGPLHLAVAVGCPVVGLYLATSPVVFGPYGPSHTILPGQAGDLPTPDSALQAIRRQLQSRA